MLFSLIGILIFAFINFFTFKYFICEISFLKPYLKFIFYVFILIFVVEFLYIFDIVYKFLNQALSNVGALFFGISFIFFCVSVFYSLGNLSLKSIHFDLKRREFLKTIFDFSIIIVTFGAMFEGIYQAFKKPKITNLNIKIKNLKDEISIVQLSDIHIGGWLKKDFLEKIVTEVNLLNADIVVITGDLIDFNPSKISKILSPINDIKSKFGVFFVPGNHEYYVGISAVLENLKKLNLRVLLNESVKIGGVNLVGLLDIMGKKMNILKPDTNLAMSEVDENLPVILLTHQPKTLDFLSKDQFLKVDLALLGHTHAGQIFPFHILVKFANNGYLYGLYKKYNALIYVSSGTGFWGPPIRFLSKNEIVKINLKKA